MLWSTSGVGFSHQNQGNTVPINTRPQMLNFKGTAQQSVDPRSAVSMRALIQLDNNWALNVNCDLINSNNSTLTKVGTWTLNVLCPLQVKCYINRVFINVCKLSLTLKHQYSETNVMHFLFSLLRIKNLYMFRPLPAHPQEALHKPHLLYCVRVLSVGCIRIGVEIQSWCSQLT
jgi:hypothetical protein